MKKNLLIVIVFLFFGQLHAQITLTIEDCTLSPPDSINWNSILNPESVLDPTKGENQYWDYSDIVVDLGTATHISAFEPVTGDTTFPMANVIHLGGISTLPGLVVPRLNYYSHDENGKVNLGWISEAIEFPLEAITGAPGDKLSFNTSSTIFEMPHVNIVYPAFYGKQWVSDHSGALNFDATIGFAGLTDAPNTAFSICHQEGEVVGWGTLRLPDSSDGTPNEVEALLVEETETCIDSFYLFGQPAPPEYLGAFGIVQGTVNTSRRYKFYTKGLKSEILYIVRSEIEGSGVVHSNILISSEVDINSGIMLTSADCALSPPDTIIRKQILNPESVLDPTEGLDQYWDYRNLAIDQEAAPHISAFDPVTDDATFPMANVTHPGGISTLPGLVVPRLNYYSHDENGKVNLGWISEAIEFPLEAITGAPGDKLSFNTSSTIFEMPHVNIMYPAFYGKQWVSDHSGALNFDATIGFAGLTDAPNTAFSICHQEGEVVGSGTLRLPDSSDGTPNEVEALLIKETETCIDSFYLYGQPAPPEYLGAFGIVQGTVNKSRRYKFHTKGLKSEILYIVRSEIEGSGDVHSDVIISSEVDINSGITLTSEDCTLSPPDTIVRLPILDPENVLNPVGGSNQYWDYTNLEIDVAEGPSISTFDLVTGNPTFPMANVTHSGGISTLPGLVVPRLNYYSHDENGKVNLGWISEDIEFSLEPITGAPGDKLSFNTSSTIFEMPHVDILYPAFYGKQWISDHSGALNFDATIGFAGLTDAPNTAFSICHQEGEVVGWGTLRLPDSSDGAMNEVEALLVEETETCIDSFYLYGQPAPPEYLGAFGIVQGNSSTFRRFKFYTKGLKSEILFISRLENEAAEILESHVTISAEVDLGTTVSVQEFSDLSIPVKYYPNPTKGQLNLEFEKSSNKPWMFSIYNSIGQKVFDYLITQPQGSIKESIYFKNQFNVGNYFFVLRNEDQKVMSNGGLFMK